MIRRPPRATRTDTLFPYTTLFRSAGFNPERRFSSLSKEIVIPNSTVTKVIDDLTYANGPGVHFVLIGFANEKQPTVMSTVDPEGLNKLLNWLLSSLLSPSGSTVDMTTVDPEGLNKLLNWLLQRKEACTVDLLDMDADSFKKGH